MLLVPDVRSGAVLADVDQGAWRPLPVLRPGTSGTQSTHALTENPTARHATTRNGAPDGHADFATIGEPNLILSRRSRQLSGRPHRPMVCGQVLKEG